MKSKRKCLVKPKCIEGALPSARSIIKTSLFLLPLFLFTACASLEKALSKAAAPYAIYDTQIEERESTGIEFAFANLSGKEIEKIKFFARISSGSADSYSDDFLTDDDGFEKEFLFDEAIEAGGAERVFIPFDEFVFDEELETYFVESLYAAEMVFEDGTLWHGTQQIY